MGALVIGFLFVSGLISLAYSQKEDPTIKTAIRRARLRMLAGMLPNRLTLDQAEDGIVLSRLFDTPELGRKFQAVVDKLKTSRSKGKKP